MSRSPETQQIIEEAFQQGADRHLAGDLQTAKALYRAIIDVAPEHGMANFNLGLLAVETGQPQAGLNHFRTALELEQTEKHWLGYLGALCLSGQRKAAQEVLNLARQNAFPPHLTNDLEAWLAKSSGTITDLPPFIKSAFTIENGPPAPRQEHDGVSNLMESFSQGRYGEAERLARELTIVYPGEGFFWKVLGAALWQQGRLEAALEPMLKSVELMPKDLEALSNLGAALDELGHTEESEALYRHILSLSPRHADALNNLGDSLRRRQHLDEAQELLRSALEACPAFPEAHNNLGCTLQAMGNLSSARHHLEEALRLRPAYPEALINLGNVLQEQCHFTEAIQALRRALTISPNHAVALNNLGNLLTILGRSDEAIPLFNQALSAKPDYFDAFSNLLFNLNYGERGTPQHRLSEAKQFGRLVSLKARQYENWDVAPDPAKLRVGFVSGDLCNHPVGYFLASVLENFAASSLEIIAFPTRDKDEALTRHIQNCCHGWHSLAGLDDRSAASLIHGSGIHILLDLSGHTAHNRLPMFAWKPAPVQASWLGYFATTGVPQIDYLLADSTGAPPEHRGHFSETVEYLPDTRLCFTPPSLAAEVADLPALENGHLTFGSFQNLAKVNGGVLAAWARILFACEGSRLRWQCKQFCDPTICSATLERLERYGIAKDRVSLHGAMPRDAYLAAHSEVDMVLDTFPYPGGTTTCEALWMGVPTLTLAGHSMHSRQGASLMAAAGLPEWVTLSQEEYVQSARRLAGEIEYLANLRAGLRSRAVVSPLFDAKRFAQNFEATLWRLWRSHSPSKVD